MQVVCNRLEYLIDILSYVKQQYLKPFNCVQTND